jgi:hypothetical protein
MTSHADASPSSASIWLNCPASVTKARRTQRLPTIYMAEGTAAHVVAELLIHGLPAPEHLVVDGFEIAVDDAMLEAVERFVGYIEQLRQTTDYTVTESSVRVYDLPEPLYGTADVIASTLATKTIEVVDLKYGRGVAVSAVNNPQLRIYGLGALESHPKDTFPIDTIRLTIVQPRQPGEVGENQEILSVEELTAWRDEVLAPALTRIADNDATEITGSHCRWCVRAGECRSLAATRMLDAKAVFDVIEDDPPPLPAELADEELAVILDKAGAVEAWLDQVRAEASRRIDHGQAVPGWKLVQKRAMEKWIDADEALIVLRETYPDVVDDMVKLGTPAAVKRVLKANQHNDIVATLTTKESSGTTLARDDDRRPAVGTDAKSVFTMLTESLAITEKSP